MDNEKYVTPQKQKLTTTLSNLLAQNIKATGGFATPSNNKKNVSGGSNSSDNNITHSRRKSLHPRTPNGGGVSGSNSGAGNASNSGNYSSFNIFPNQVVNTPPAKRFQRVRNPFEAALADRLHLPLIASPSLFQRPTTPQMSSTQFEWTIEEVSSLKPSHLEPHETQFQDSPDPDYERKAQSAISCYFKEQQIVPSPVDCPLRQHRIVLSEQNGNTPMAKPGRRIRDCGTQTMLSLPVQLPRALEEALRPYFQMSTAVDSESTPRERSQFRSNNNNSNNSSGDYKDTSLRRKLFDMHNIVVVDGGGGNSNGSEQGRRASSKSLSPFSSPVVIAGKLSDSLDKSSFGSLSPISAATDDDSPHAQRRTRLHNFLELSAVEQELSPIQAPPARQKSLKNSINAAISNDNYRASSNISVANTTTNNGDDDDDDNKTRRFTPDRSSSPLRCLETAELSIESSFNVRVSQLAMHSGAKALSKSSSGTKNLKKSNEAESSFFLKDDDTVDLLDVDEDDEEMQVSQLSAQSSNCSSYQSDTPRGKRRSASRKNLSQSFCVNWLDDDDDDEEDNVKEVAAAPQLPTKIDILLQQQSQQQQQLPMVTAAKTILATAENDTKDAGLTEQQRLLFYRTDSGFNEMTSSLPPVPDDDDDDDEEDDGEGEDIACSPQDVSMVCCSTPSKLQHLAF